MSEQQQQTSSEPGVKRCELDTVRDRFDIRCGPLSLGADVGSEPVKQ